MSKTISVTTGKWIGSITIADPLTIPQAKLIEAGRENPPEIQDALDEYRKIVDEFGIESEQAKNAGKKRIQLSSFAYDDKHIPAVIACVEKWELNDFPKEVNAGNFPASPRGESHALIEKIFKELLTVYFGEIAVPNA